MSITPAPGQEAILFRPAQRGAARGCGDQAVKLVENYLANCLDSIAEAFGAKPGFTRAIDETGVDLVFDQIIHRLGASEFNYQSRGRVRPLLTAASASVRRAVVAGEPILIYFLYHGGYRARPFPGPNRLQFAPDVTELLLIYQVARLRSRVIEAYPPGVVFTIVINDGVAMYANDIPYRLTERYVDRLRGMIDRLGAGGVVRLLVQSELGPFAPPPPTDRADGPGPEPIADPMVQRFLGRDCSPREARRRLARYQHAETVWGRQIGAIAEAASGVICRQVAHPACLSFRPFPGGAIRVQNGAIGFRVSNGQVTPSLITTLTPGLNQVRDAPLSDPVLARIVADALDQDTDWPSVCA